MCVVIMSYIWIGLSWIFLYKCGIMVLQVFIYLFFAGSLCAFPRNCTMEPH